MIGRGGVRIERNPSLCFVDTIDWLYIANGTQMRDHFIDSNKPHNECPSCPDKTAFHECPTSKDNWKKGYCWNQQHCQKSE